ncbi:hypothetical protein EV281_10451 [Rhizobium sp. BK418]|nr:hypothetical protein EV281_10451 [Rhizobium sp. BK418]
MAADIDINGALFFCSPRPICRDRCDGVSRQALTGLDREARALMAELTTERGARSGKARLFYVYENECQGRPLTRALKRSPASVPGIPRSRTESMWLRPDKTLTDTGTLSSRRWILNASSCE